MTGSADAHAVLGLQQGADRDAIEQAYRRLIKRHHPDRAGGDTSRAAEINRAYYELRGPPPQGAAQRQPADIAEAISLRRAGRRRAARPRPRRSVPWKRVGLVALLLAALVWRAELANFAAAAAAGLRAAIATPEHYRTSNAALPAIDALQGQLDTAAIDQSIAQAQQLMREGREDDLADVSRECHRRLRLQPSAERLDRCAALDFTAVALARNDPLHDQGPFSASAVTAREMSAARLLSSDYLIIEARLDQVRARVEAAVAPPPPAPRPPTPTADQAVRTDLPALRPD